MSNISYTLEYTAEQINRRLDLINENKNLLPFPYYNDSTIFPDGLENVGDGSILTVEYNTKPTKPILLNIFSLPTGTYEYSIAVTNVIDGTSVTNPGFNLSIEGATVKNGQIILEQDTTITVYLTVPSGDFNPDLLVKPMIRMAGTESDWVPYMSKIGSYVDERFDSTNTKIKVLANKLKAISDFFDMLPDCTKYPDGAMLVVKDRQWAIVNPFADGEVLLVENDSD